jgi:hypothetical protein
MNFPVSRFITVIASAVLFTSCATSGNFQSKEDIAIAADFNAVKATTPSQKKALEKLPSDKFTSLSHNGKTLYVLPDKADGQAYVGGPKQWESYQQLRQAQSVANEVNQGPSSYEREEAVRGDWHSWNSADGYADWSSEDGQTD